MKKKILDCFKDSSFDAKNEIHANVPKIKVYLCMSRVDKFNMYLSDYP